MLTIHKRVREWLEALFHAGIVVGILFFLCWPFRVDGNSMETNFHSMDRVVVSRVLLYMNQIDREDIVVCKIKDADSSICLFKRVIGLPGDRVQIAGGKVWINRNELKEPYLGNTSTIGNIDVLLEEDEYFILGDNREISYDSRQIGPVKRKELVGKVLLRWYPIKSFQLY